MVSTGAALKPKSALSLLVQVAWLTCHLHVTHTHACHKLTYKSPHHYSNIVDDFYTVIVTIRQALARGGRLSYSANNVCVTGNRLD